MTGEGAKGAFLTTDDARSITQSILQPGRAGIASTQTRRYPPLPSRHVKTPYVRLVFGHFGLQPF